MNGSHHTSTLTCAQCKPGTTSIAPHTVLSDVCKKVGSALRVCRYSIQGSNTCGLCLEGRCTLAQIQSLALDQEDFVWIDRRPARIDGGHALLVHANSQAFMGVCKADISWVVALTFGSGKTDIQCSATMTKEKVNQTSHLYTIFPDLITNYGPHHPTKQSHTSGTSFAPSPCYPITVVLLR